MIGSTYLPTYRGRGWDGWEGGAKVLNTLSVPGRPTNFDNSRTRTYCACSGCGIFSAFFFFHIFLSSIISIIFFFPLSGRWSDID